MERLDCSGSMCQIHYYIHIPITRIYYNIIYILYITRILQNITRILQNILQEYYKILQEYNKNILQASTKNKLLQLLFEAMKNL